MNDEGKPEEKFEFDNAGQSLGYISIDQAQVLAMRLARENPGDYGSDYSGIRMSLEVIESRETDEYYVVTLAYRPLGTFSGNPGREQFYIAKEGTVENRQVVLFPSKTKQKQVWAIGGITTVAVIILASFFLVLSGDDEGKIVLETTASSPNQSGAADIEITNPTPTKLTPTRTLRPTRTATIIPTPTPVPDAEWLEYQVAIDTMIVDYEFSSISASASPAFISDTFDFDRGTGNLTLFSYDQNDRSHYCYTWATSGRILTQVAQVSEGICPS